MAREESNVVDHKAMKSGFRAIVEMVVLINIWKLLGNGRVEDPEAMEALSIEY